MPVNAEKGSYAALTTTRLIVKRKENTGKLEPFHIVKKVFPFWNPAKQSLYHPPPPLCNPTQNTVALVLKNYFPVADRREEVFP